MEVLSNRKLEHNLVEAQFKADRNELEEAVEAAYLRRKSSLVIPGFRKGKVPRKVIERQYGDTFFFEDAVNDLYRKSVVKSVDELELDVVNIPNIEVVTLTKEDGVVFKATICVKPEIEITGYLGLEVPEHVHTVTDEDVESELQRLRERGARLIDVTDRPAISGDSVTFDFAGYADGERFEGGSAEKFQLEIGSGQFIPGFEPQLVGKSVGEDFDVNVTFPEDYQAEPLRGKDATFKCHLHEIRGKELADLDDEFAKDVSDFDTLDELRTDLKGKLEEHAKAHSEEHFAEALVDLLIAKIGDGVEIPDAMVEDRVEDLLHEWELRNRQQGLTIKKYLEYTGQTEEQFRELFKEPAVKQVKLRLALEKIAEIENIEITDGALDAEYEKLAADHKMDIAKVKRLIPERSLKKDMKAERAMDIVKENAKQIKAD